MQEALLEWGGLTDKQTDLVRNALARAEKWEAERQARYAAQKAEDLKGGYVGEVRVRMDFTLTVQHVHSYDTDFGTTYINVCKDAAGNTVVYKGSNGWMKGETLTVKATAGLFLRRFLAVACRGAGCRFRGPKVGASPGAGLAGVEDEQGDRSVAQDGQTNILHYNAHLLPK